MRPPSSNIATRTRRGCSISPCALASAGALSDNGQYDTMQGHNNTRRGRGAGLFRAINFLKTLTRGFGGGPSYASSEDIGPQDPGPDPQATVAIQLFPLFNETFAAGALSSTGNEGAENSPPPC